MTDAERLAEIRALALREPSYTWPEDHVMWLLDFIAKRDAQLLFIETYRKQQQALSHERIANLKATISKLEYAICEISKQAREHVDELSSAWICEIAKEALSP